jgi:SAM-dependent MidA family methyltransferase
MSAPLAHLSEQAKAINQRLSLNIAQSIEQNGGVISYAEFIQQVLYTPRLGYYQNNLDTFGEQGDFITAPEMGGLFAKGLAQSIISLHSDLSQNLLEIGAGSGKLAAELLQTLEQEKRLPEQYFILEPSANLQNQQKQTLEQLAPHLSTKVTWLKALPENFTGTIFANEVLDAIPFERVTYLNGEWHQLGVGKTELSDSVGFTEQPLDIMHENKLPLALRIAANNIKTECENNRLAENNPFIEGYTTEIRPLIKPWIKSLANCLSQGVIILFDYGYPQHEYYHPQRTDGTMRCFSRHSANSQALELIGLQDITAHVDFTAVAIAASDNDLNVSGFTTQAGFLLENKVTDVLQSSAQQSNNSQVVHYALSQELHKLTAPGEMGELIKVMALTKNTEQELSGFELQNQLHRL